MSTYDIIGLSVFLIFFFGYQYTYFFISHNLKKETRENKINLYRQYWLEIIIKENQSTFAIQTIRNLTMANTFLVSLVMILMGGLISILSANLNLIQTLEMINELDSNTYWSYLRAHPVAVKILVGLFMLLISAYNFTMTLRILYNMNFTASSVMKRPEEKQYQLDQLRRQARHFSTGLRSLYFFFGPMLWILDTTAMLVFTIVATVAFLRFDFLHKVQSPQRD